MITHLTSNRVLGAFPISIATSLALEFLLGVKSEANPDPVPNQVKNYKEIWFNIKTLFRNLYNALDKDAQKEILDGELFEALLHEMEVILSIIDEYSIFYTKCYFYVSDYDGLDKKYKLALFKTANTENQIIYNTLMENTIKHIKKQKNINAATSSTEVCEFKLYLKPVNQTTALILTHIPFDLFSYKAFSKLELLESHTGKIKDRSLWSSKYANGKELQNIPFMEGLLPFFGDDVFFKPFPKKARDTVIALATEYRWSPVTTRDKVLYSLGTLKDLYLRETILTFFH